MKKILILLISLSISQFSISQNKKSKEVKSELAKINLSGLKFRSVGPALTAGRIADIAVNKNNPKIYYVAVASGGLWKTQNSGNTFEPILSYKKLWLGIEGQERKIINQFMKMLATIVVSFVVLIEPR